MTLPTTLAKAVKVQAWDGAAWQDFGGAHDLGTIVRTRRFSLAPRQSVTTTKLRVIRHGADDLTGSVFSLDAVRLWNESAELSPVELYNFDFDVMAQRYKLVSTPGNLEVYKNDVRQASVPTPYTANQVSAVAKVQQLDTFLSFHVAVPPNRVTRQGADDEWDSRAAVFSNVPLFDYTGSKAGGVNEQQQITFDTYVNGDTFNVTIETATTDPIVYSSVSATLIASLTAALEALPNIGAGGVTVTNLGTDQYQVEFVGDNAAEDVGPMAPASLHTAAGGVFAATLRQGQPGGEAIFSATRGYPGCGAFYQQRLYMAGLGSRPQDVLGSVIGDFFNFDIKGRPTAAALAETLDTDEAVLIYALYPGRHLQIFGSSAEFFFPVEPIVSPAGIKQTTRRGIAPYTPLGFMDGATVFVSRTGEGLCKFQFDQVEQSYTAQWLNILNPDLVLGVVGMAFRRALSPKETDRALLVRGDGLIASMMALLDQNVVGFDRWTTDGQFVAACADIAGDMHVATLRTFGGSTEIYLEAVDKAAYLDHEIDVAVVGDQVRSVAVPAYLNGQTLALMIDGVDAGDVTIADAAAVLPNPALRQVAVGRLFTPSFDTLPLQMQTDPRIPLGRQMRSGEIALQLGPTAGEVRVGILGADRDWRLPLRRRPDALSDAADSATPFRGWTRVAEIAGFNDQEAVTVTQTRPGPFNVRALAVKVDT